MEYAYADMGLKNECWKIQKEKRPTVNEWRKINNKQSYTHNEGKTKKSDVITHKNGKRRREKKTHGTNIKEIILMA